VKRPLVVIDSDVLGRQRTGDETYVENLLRELPAAAPDLRLAAVTRNPELVPEGVEPIELPAGSQEWRMASSLPRLLGRVRPALAHFQHSLPLRCPCPAVLTVHDLSFERDSSVMSRRDRLVFRTVVPRSARRAALVLAVSRRTRADLVELYRMPPERIVVTPHGVDPIFRPAAAAENGRYLLFVGAVQARKNPLAALRAADEAGLPLVVVGPAKDAALAGELVRRGATVRGWVEKGELAELYRGAAALLLPTRYEGFGLPVLEAMASGTPVVATPDPALREVAGDAAVYAEADELAGAVQSALSRRAELVSAGLERARLFSWAETARLTADAYRAALR
jgi:glycosyltransferase involved in cell wall biosynthesis